MRSLFGAVAFFAIAIGLIVWAQNPGELVGGSNWESRFLAKIFTLPLIWCSMGAGLGLLIGRFRCGLLVGLATAGVSSPFLFIWWWNS
jgi:hypothetical protein